MRPAITHRHAETLGGTEDDIRALLARRLQQHQRHKIGRHADDDVARLEIGDECAVVMRFAGGADLLQQHAEQLVMIARALRFIDNQLKAEGLRAGFHDVQRLRMNILGDKKFVGVLQLADAFGHRHRFRRRRRFVQQRRGGDIQPGQIQRQLLEVQQRLQPALRHLRLIRGVGGIPARIFQQVAQDNGRRQHRRIAHADIRFETLVAAGDRFQFRQRLMFRQRIADSGRPRQLNVGRHDAGD